MGHTSQSHPEMKVWVYPNPQWIWLLSALIDDGEKLTIVGRLGHIDPFLGRGSPGPYPALNRTTSVSRKIKGRLNFGQSQHCSFCSMSNEDSLISTLAIREQYRDEYWRKRDPIADDRLLWRAQTFRHTVHLLPGQTILELGCGELRLTRALLRVSRGENPITAVTFQNTPPNCF